MGDRMVELVGRAQELSRSDPRPPVGRALGLECATLAIEHTRQEHWIAQLEEAKAWLEGQRANWQRISEERGHYIQNLQQQRDGRQRIAEERERAYRELLSTRLVRLASRFWKLRRRLSGACERGSEGVETL